jgi:hypothetical protein
MMEVMVRGGWTMKLTIHLHPVPWLRCVVTKLGYIIEVRLNIGHKKYRNILPRHCTHPALTSVYNHNSSYMSS